MRYYILLLLLLSPLFVLSQGNSLGASNLRLPETAFAAATSEAFVADPFSLQSIQINPANIASLKSYDITFSHLQWIQDIRTEFLVAAAPLRFGSLSFSLTNNSIGDLELREIPGPAIGTFSFQTTIFQLTYGVKITSDLCIGISPKYIYEKIFVDETTGYGLDAGVLYRLPLEGLLFGCSLTNIGNLSAFRTEQIDLPTMIHIGSTYSFHEDEITFRTAVAYATEFGTNYQHLDVGGEITYNNLISVRLGYQTGYESRNVSYGIGFRYSIASIDYGYVPFLKQLGDAHIISIGFSL